VAVLILEDVSVSRGDQSLLAGVDLSVDAGQSVAVMGPSGSGKTSLLHVICGLRRPTTGLVSVNEEAVGNLSDARRSAVRLREFGLVFQSDELLPELSVGENVGLPLRLLGKKRTEATAAAHEVLTALGIADLTDRHTHEISGGQAQRASIARAVIHRPSVVLADEPTASLDVDTARTAMALLIDTSKTSGAATLIVTHDPEVAGLCDVTLTLTNKRLTAGVAT
jgi:putative ABC transport system ATP-binding protein